MWRYNCLVLNESDFLRHLDAGQVQKNWESNMVKAIFFDTGPIISLVMSRLITVLPELKRRYGGKFYITPAVKHELVERPLTFKRFEFEALEVLKLIEDGVLEVYTAVPNQKVQDLKRYVNSAFRIGKQTMDVIQEGELEAITTALQVQADAIVIDERTLRLLIEKCTELEKLLEFRFKRDVIVDLNKLKQFAQQFQSVKIIRSAELVAVAYKLGLLDSYVPKQKNGEKILLDAVLWATKLNGCAVTGEEIEQLEKALL